MCVSVCVRVREKLSPARGTRSSHTCCPESVRVSQIQCQRQPETVPESARDGVDSNRVQECAIHGYRQMPDEHKKELGTYETVKARFWDQVQPHVLPRQ